MEISLGINRFIKENIDLIDTNNWDVFMKRVKWSPFLDDKNRSQIRQILSQCDIFPLNEIDYIPEGWFSHDLSITHLDIPNHIREINQNVFAGDSNLQTIHLPLDLEKLGMGAFTDCISLSNMDLSNYPLQVLTSNIFRRCYNLQSIKLPKNLRQMGTCTFYDCALLNNVVFPKSLRVIDKETFTNCRSLTNISFEGTIEEWKTINRYDRCFVGVPAKIIICTDGITNLRPRAQWQG